MFRSLLALLLLLIALPAHADPSDISAASRGVVRVVLVQSDGETVQYIGHGSGFAVAPNLIVTNAHVIAPAREDDTMLIGVVPGEGTSGYLARIVAVSPRNDLALLRLVDKGSVAPLTLFPGAIEDGAEVYAVGYPGNVDLAQGLSLAEIVEPQAAVKTRGYLSAGRSSRQFETLLHTAPIGSGNSGGPLLDSCGRVIGVNSFGTTSEGADSEFYFAVSPRELANFLRQAGVKPRLGAMPCRSLAELDSAERERLQGERAGQEAQARNLSLASARAQATAQRRAELAVISERENGLALAALLLVAALAAGGAGAVFELRGARRNALIAGAVAGALLLGTLVAWFSRPTLDAIDERAAEALAKDEAPAGKSGDAAAGGAMICVVDPARTRATVSDVGDVALDWTPEGCVNGRSQYGLADQQWSRILVPNDEATVSVNSYDPATRVYKVERFLLPFEAMTAARAARAKYQAPSCGAGEAAALQLGADQAAIRSALPANPNERLVYKCQAR